MANSFFLFKLPRVKEILGRTIKDFVARNDLDLTTLAYRDSNQGKQFEERQKKRKEKFEQKQEINEQIMLNTKKYSKIKAQSRSVIKRHKNEMDWQEWDELADEIREMKKEKRACKKKPKTIWPC